MTSQKGETKHEYAGPIASDSLAAESLRSGGQFAKGNPADISSVTGAHSTFASHPDTGYQEIKPGHKKGDQETFETGRAGGMDEDLKTKAARVGTLGGGIQHNEGYSGVDASGRDTTHPYAVQNHASKRRDAKQHKNKDDDECYPKLSLRGGTASSEEGV